MYVCSMCAYYKVLMGKISRNIEFPIQTTTICFPGREYQAVISLEVRASRHVRQRREGVLHQAGNQACMHVHAYTYIQSCKHIHTFIYTAIHIHNANSTHVHRYLHTNLYTTYILYIHTYSYLCT